MLLQLTTTRRPATDLGYLLHKNPARAQAFDLSFGRVHVFYPEATPERCTAALLLDVDSVGLVRGKGGPEGEGGLLQQYVNDRPYVASSFLSVAIARVFGSALTLWRLPFRSRPTSRCCRAVVAKDSCAGSSSPSVTPLWPSRSRSTPSFRNGARAATSA